MKHISSVWFLAFTKRLLQKGFFVVILCLFPLFSVVINWYSHYDRPLIQVALYNEGGTSLATDTIASLKDLDSTIHFYETDSAKHLYTDVKRTKAECGYIFTREYSTENILQGSKRKNSIEVIQSPSSVLAGTMNELVFAAYFKTYNRELLLDYLQQPRLLKTGQNNIDILDKAAAYYEEYIHNDNILQPDTSYSNLNVDSTQQLMSNAQEITRAYVTDLGRGIVSVLVLLAALCGGLQMIQDSRKGLFGPLASGRRLLMELLDIMAPATLVATSGLLGLLILPANQGLWKELLGLLIYIPTVTLLAYILVKLTHHGSLYPSLLPMLTLGALIFPPVFIDLSVYAKVLTIPKYIMVNTYYLNLVHGDIKEWSVGLVVLALLTIKVLWQSGRR